MADPEETMLRSGLRAGPPRHLRGFGCGRHAPGDSPGLRLARAPVQAPVQLHHDVLRAVSF
eukprot:12940754-Alexandrium_andersonii.AAC.1